MENGVGIVDRIDLGEMVMEDEVLESRVEERAEVGSDDSKESEGDDVFEEAIAAEPPRVFPGVSDVDQDDNVPDVGHVAGSVEVDKTLSVGNDVEEFEEAIGGPALVGDLEEELPVVVEHKKEGVGGESVDESTEGEINDVESVMEKFVAGELNGTENDASESAEEGEIREVSGISAADAMGVCKDGSQDDQNSAVVADGMLVDDSTEVGAAQIFQGDNPDSQQEVESIGAVLHPAERIEEVKETLALLEFESIGEVLYPDEKTEDLKETLALPDAGHHDDKGWVNKDAPDLCTANFEEVKGNLVIPDTENKVDEGVVLSEETSTSPFPVYVELIDAANLGLENQDDGSQESKHTSVAADSGHHGNNVKPEDKLFTSVEDRTVTPEVENLSKSENAVVQGDANVQAVPIDLGATEIKGSQLQPTDKLVEPSNFVPKEPENEGAKAEVVNQSIQGNGEGIVKPAPDVSPSEVKSASTPSPEDKLFTSAEDRTVTPEVEILSKSENAVVQGGANIQARPIDLGATEIKGSKLQPTDKLVEPSNSVPKEPENKGAKAEVVNQNIQGNGEGVVKPAPDVSPSGVKPANPTPSPARPAGLGRVAPLLEPAHRVVQQPRVVNGTSSQMQNQLTEDTTNGEADENDETREKLQMIRVKFLRLAHRLGQTPHNVVVAQVLYRLGLAEQLRGRNGGRVNAFSFDRASAMAEQLEAAGQEPLDFSCTIMVLGKTGIGKSATINSIFDEVKFGTDAFQMGTKKVQDVVGTVQGIKVRVIDTPGLLPSWSDQRHNEKILHSVKRFIKKTPPDIVLYLDRLDMQSRDLGDLPLLRTITDIFGPSIWFNAIVVLTHAASAPPEGPNGTATSYDMFVTQRSHVVQQAIRQAAGDMRLMNPVSLVENHSACRTNRAGQRVLPNGQVWKPHLLLLSFASKILAEANTLLKLQDSPPGKPFSARTKAPPLPFLLSSLLQSRPQLKLPEDQFGDDDVLDDDLDDSSDSNDESEYDKFPFKRLTTAELAKLTKTQKKAYYNELDQREKLLMKKQLKEEKKRRKIMKKLAASAKDLPIDYSDEVEEESGGAASVPVPMPDLALPASFDSDNPTHRYRHLDSPNQWVVRPVLDTHGWDHDIGYEGVNVEKLFVVKQAVPVSFSGQVTKDKKDANLQMEIASSIKHGEGKATSLGFDLQTLGKDTAYTLRSETMFSNYRRNKATAGLSATLLGDALTAGVKVEDKLIVNRRFRLVMSGGAMTGRGDVAYGGSLEATLRDKDHPFGRSLSTIGLSLMDWHGDLAIGGNLQSQIPVGRFTNLIARANLNNRGSGQVSIRLNSSEQLQIALIGLIPLVRKLLGYHQQLEFGQ